MDVPIDHGCGIGQSLSAVCGLSSPVAQGPSCAILQADGGPDAMRAAPDIGADRGYDAATPDRCRKDKRR
jgi:hypothetical protein